jgi:hypothetical protein
MCALSWRDVIKNKWLMEGLAARPHSLSHFSFPLPRNKAALPTRHHTRASSTSAPVSRTTFPGDCSLSSTCARVSSSSSRTHTRSARRLFSTIPSRFSPVHPTTHVVRHRRRRPRAAGGSLRPGAEMFRQLAAHDGERKTKHTHTHTPKPKPKKKKKTPRPDSPLGSSLILSILSILSTLHRQTREFIITKLRTELSITDERHSELRNAVLEGKDAAPWFR